MDETTMLFRPVGQKELELIRQSEFRAFPPRLQEQPIFYPVLNEEYATQIARDWNARRNSERVGYVTPFLCEERISQAPSDPDRGQLHAPRVLDTRR
jgi:hypothetical protein